MNFLNCFSKDQQVVNDHFRLLRKRRFERHGPKVKCIGFHNAMHHVMLPGLVLLRRLEGRKLTVLADRRTARSPKTPTVYACTHIGGKDIESAFEAIGDPCFLLLGDPGILYRNFDGLMLWLNGLICLETRDKTDRHIAKVRGTALLKQGGSLLIFPEGAWNITENHPVMALFPGAASFALESGADIVPIALERYGRHYYANIGTEIYHAQIAGMDTKAATALLRDTLAALKWEIWEHMGIHCRADLNPDYAERVFYPMFAPVGDYTMQDAMETRYRDKSSAAASEVFAHLKNLHPSRNNAFLLRDR